MKTDTNERILAYIKEKGSITAKEMANFFGISPQALFRHLKKLRIEDKIQRIGSAPKVRYVPDQGGPPALAWAVSKAASAPPKDWYCPTADVWQARFVRLGPDLVRAGFSASEAGLIAGAIGEIGDNCFAHNVFAWPDIPGCWFEVAVTRSSVQCYIADRGRGILASLRTARPSLETAADALLAALTERISGRVSEARGNGLKFALSALGQLPNHSGIFILHSGNARFANTLPPGKIPVAAAIATAPQTIRGTYAEIIIKK